MASEVSNDGYAARGLEVSPISAPRSIVKSFRDGFRNARDDVQLAVATETVTSACFGAATKRADMGVGYEHDFRPVARVFNASTAEVVCEEVESQ